MNATATPIESQPITVTVVDPPKRTPRQKLQDRLVSASARLFVKTSLFTVVPLSDSEKTFIVTNKVKGQTVTETLTRKCGECLAPATHKNVMDRDSGYVSYLCVECVEKER